MSGSSFLASALLLAAVAAPSPARAAPCTGAANGPNSTACINGSSGTSLDYVTDNPAYVNGDFELLLRNHDVNAAAGHGITFDDVAGGSGRIILQDDSDVTSGAAGDGIAAAPVNSATTIEVRDTSSVTGSIRGIEVISEVGDITILTAALSSVAGNSSDGIFADTNAAGNVVVNAQGTVTGSGAGDVDGIFVNTETGTVSVTTGIGAISGANDGIDVIAQANSVSVTTGTGAVVGNAGNGIDAEGLRGVTVETHGQITAAGNSAASGNDGIRAQTVTGLAKVTTAAGTTVDSAAGAGINAATTVDGNVEVIANGTVTGGSTGIDADAVFGTVSVTTGMGGITGSGGNGIDATASGAVTILTGGYVAGAVNAINAVSSAGDTVSVTTGGTVYGAGGAGIKASASGAGTVTIDNNSNAGGSVAGIVATSVTGAIQIRNSAYIVGASFGVDDLLAIRAAGGPVGITNNGVIFGRVETGAGADVLDNNNVGWATEGDSDFGAGIDAINNNDTLQVANEPGGAGEVTRFLNLESLNNNGFIVLADQAAGDGSNISDRLQTSGDYSGVNDARLMVDAFLGGPGSVSDVMIVGGSTFGTTFVVVTNTNAGPGAFNPTGILVVSVMGASAAERFELVGGPIDTGLFAYDLVFDAAVGEHRLVGLPDREAFEPLAAVAGAQEIWRETADVWSTRQENLRDMIAGGQRVTAVADPVLTGSAAPSGSLWASGLGSWSKRDDDASFALLNANLDFDMSYKQEIYGVVGGADFRTDLGEGGGSLLFGVLAGYIDSKLDFDEGSTSIDSKGATLGAYAGLLSNGFFATVLVKADLLKMDYTAGSLAVGDNDDADVTSVGVRGDLGYRFGDTLFVEPVISVDGFSTKIDDFSIGGADIDAGTNESYRAGAGLRVGYGDEAMRASATARIWDVFSTDNEVDVLSGVPLGLSDDDLEGVYGDVSGQIDVSLSASATVYLKGGVLFSEDTTKPSASGGFAFYW